MRILLLLFFTISTVLIHAQVFVYQYATGLNDGTSWENAYTDLHFALEQAGSGDDLWIAAGVYEPSENGDRTASFRITKALNLYGGFDGYETSPDQRDDMGRAILDGDLGVKNEKSDNTLHVLIIEDVDGTVVLDGIETRSGNANGVTEEDQKGAGIYCKNAKLVMNTCNVMENKSDLEAAGIYFNPANSGELKISNSFFFKNSSKDAEAIAINTNESTLRIDNSIFREHENGKSVIKADSCNAYFRHNNFYRNKDNYNGVVASTGTQENKLSFVGDVFQENKAELSTRMIFVTRTSIFIDSCTFKNNQFGGGDCLHSYSLDTLDIRNSVVENNSGDGTIGFYANSGDAVFLRNVRFTNNTVGTYGCGYIDCTVFQADGLEITDIDSEGSVVGMFIRSKNKAEINNGKFERINSDSQGLFYLTTSDTMAVGSINYSVFNDITTKGSNGAMYISGFNNFAISYSTFDNVTSGGTGGAYALEGTNTHVAYNCEFKNCSGYFGGAIYETADLFVLNNTTFTNNYSDYQGGAINSSGKRTQISNVTFNGNEAHFGGGLYFTGSELVVFNSTFENNKVAKNSSYGGAIYTSSSKTLIANSLFKDNKAVVSIDDDPESVLGGAVYAYSDEFQLYGSIFDNNTAGTGGAVYFNGDNSLDKNIFLNNTILNNKASKDVSGAFYIAEGDVLIKNSILWENGNFPVAGSLQASIHYQTSISDGGVYPGITAQDPDLLGYKPASNSIAVNRGEEDEAHTQTTYQMNKDIMKNSRVQSNRVDIGAVETEYEAVFYSVTGKVLHTKSENCDPSVDTSGIKDIIIYASTASDERYYANTNEKGEYSFLLPKGTYHFIQFLNDIRDKVVEFHCPKNGAYNSFVIDGTTELPVFYDRIVLCELVDISIHTGAARNCYSGRRTISVTNVSKFPLSDKQLKLERSNQFTSLLSTSLEPIETENENQILSFQLPVLEPYQTFRFNFVDSVLCDPFADNLGEKIELSASIPLKDECVILNSSVLKIEGDCYGDTAVFTIASTDGIGGSIITSYRLFLNDTLVKNKDIVVYPGVSLSVKLPNNTGVSRLEIGDPNEPNSLKELTLLSCDTEQSGFSGYYNVTSLAPKSELKYFSTIIGSYDPNEIAVSPKGWGDDGSILKDQLLKYKIFFQNTGSDTAFSVKIVDTLGTNYDISTFQNLDASHNVNLNILGGNPSVAIWTLNGINLPDSATDLTGSQGYVSFSISLDQELAFDTEVLNSGSIYFDYNEPIITNKVLNTVKEKYPENDDVEVVEDDEVLGTDEGLYKSIFVAPNPFSSQISIQGLADYNGVMFRLINISGKVVYQSKASEMNDVNLDQTGVFVYEIYSRSKVIKRGKLVKLQE